MARKTLTPRLVDELQVKAGQARTIYFDDHPDAPKGFALRVTSSGARSFYLLRTLKASGRRVWVHLGPAEGSGLEAARAAAEVRAGQIAKDVNPNVEARLTKRREKAERLERAIAAGEWTVSGMVRSYITSRPKISLRTANNYLHLLRHNIEGSELGTMRARDVVREDVRRLTARITKRTPSVAWAVLQLLRWSFRWAMEEEVLVVDVDGRRSARPRVDRDPTRGVEDQVAVAKRTVRERYLSDEELAAYWSRLDSMTKVTRSAFARIILLCGTRSTETFMARWRDVQDLDGDSPRWLIPAAERKGRKDAKRAQLIPLSPQAVELFRSLRELTGQRERVFLAQGISHKRIGAELAHATCTVAAHTANVPLYGKKTLKGPHAEPPAKSPECLADVTVHDLRRSVGTGLQRLGAPPHVISIVLGHTREAGATAADSHYTHDRRGAEHRLWLERWSNHIEALAAGARPGRKVIPHPSAGAL